MATASRRYLPAKTRAFRAHLERFIQKKPQLRDANPSIRFSTG